MRPVYAIGKRIIWLMFHLGGIQVYGRENIPDDKSIIIICNHVSYADPLALAIVYPRQITFIAKEAFRHNFFTRILFGKCLGAVFLKKDESDLGAMRVMINELKQERAVGIFPEGRRELSQQLNEFRPGASYLSQRSGTRVLPMAVLNTGDCFRFWKRNVRVMIGEPIEAPPVGKADREQLAKYTMLYHDRVADLLNEGRHKLIQQGRKMRIAPQKRRK